MSILLNKTELSFEYSGAGPGMSGRSALSVSPSGHDRYSVQFLGDTTNDQGYIIEIGDFRATDWRGVVGSVCRENAICYYVEGSISDPGLPWPDEIVICGNRTPAVDVIACAWAGTPFRPIALALCRATDEQLWQLFDMQGGKINSRPFVWRLARIIRILEKYDMSWEDAATVIAELDHLPPSTTNIWGGAKPLIKRAQANNEEGSRRGRKIAQEETEFLGPFEKEIEKICERHRQFLKGGGGTIGKYQHAAEFRRRLRKYVLMHRKIPTGTDKVLSFGGGFRLDEQDE